MTGNTSPKAPISVPDFELDDNAGRTSEQSRSHHAGELTRDDLLRQGLARASARSMDEGPLPFAGESVEPWTELLNRCEGPDELAAVVHHVCYAEDGALARLHQFLEHAAELARQTPGAAHVAAAIDAQPRNLDLVGGDLDDVVTDLLDAARIPSDAAGGARAQAAQSASPGVGSAPMGAADDVPRPSATAPPRQGRPHP